ncbi:MAG: hypothetical protein R6X20_04835 [Phycisphaerae bacterium]
MTYYYVYGEHCVMAGHIVPENRLDEYVPADGTPLSVAVPDDLSPDYTAMTEEGAWEQLACARRALRDEHGGGHELYRLHAAKAVLEAAGYDAGHPCTCCETVAQHIEQHLDPSGTLRQAIAAGEITRATAAEDAEAFARSQVCMGSLIGQAEIEEYLLDLINEVREAQEA